MPLVDGIRLLGECFRILKKGSKVRVATPDIMRLLALYNPEPSELQNNYIDWNNLTFLADISGYNPAIILNNMFYDWGHRFIYDQNFLALIMTKAGFAELAVQPAGERPDPNISGVEKQGHLVGASEFNAYETIAVEGRKP